jgi:Flp pilus assembly protein TadG
MIKQPFFYKANGRASRRGQAMVEFAIALPVLLMLLFGIMEVGRLLLTHALVSNASRNAVRYASTIGLEDNGLTRFNYCEGIKGVALASAYIIPEADLVIEVEYDEGSSDTKFAECDQWNASLVDNDVDVESEDRVTVTITTVYKPLVKLIPIPQQTISYTSSRTILGIVELDN